MTSLYVISSVLYYVLHTYTQFSTFIACVICKLDFIRDNTETIRASNCQHGKCSMIKFEINNMKMFIFVYV